MRLLCGPDTFETPAEHGALRVVLYGRPGAADQGSAGEAARLEVLRRKLEASPRAWDFLSIALSVVAADLGGRRDQSADGWTREFDLEIALAEPEFWNSQVDAISNALAFLTTDRWRLHFRHGGTLPSPPSEPVHPEEDCVSLLSGGLDSLIGVIDLATLGRKPFAVSQVVRGDADKQVEFAARIGGGLKHLQLNHNAHVPGVKESSQRARSFIFLAFGVLAATTLRHYHDGSTVSLYVSENGFITINPPLTGARLGSLSTRTAHPEFLGRLQIILEAAGLRVRLENPYQTKTKGEMLVGCADQVLLKPLAPIATSCGRFQRFSYRHCGRCVPCQVRRAAFLEWGVRDTTRYVYESLGKEDGEHAGFDDVRSVAMAIGQVETEGLESWLGPTLNSLILRDVRGLKALVQRGLDELKSLHQAYGVR
jgi:7-cyano-7-deazaguanine synthase in queuosine biosynthesis